MAKKAQPLATYKKNLKEAQQLAAIKQKYPGRPSEMEWHTLKSFAEELGMEQTNKTTKEECVEFITSKLSRDFKERTRYLS